MIVEYRVGVQSLTEGDQVPPRMGHQGDMVISAGHPDYYEMAYRTTLGELNSFMVATPAAGVAPGTALSTTPPFALWNPPGSGRNLIILRTRIGYVSGTLGAGQIWYSKIDLQSSAPTGGTTLAPRTSVVGNASSGVGQAFQGATLVAVPTQLVPSPYNFGAYVGTAVAINEIAFDDVKGQIFVQPGGVFCMSEIGAAGTAPLVLFGCDWMEEKQ